MYRLEQFDLTDYDNWDSNLKNVESYNVIYNNEPISEKNISLAVLVNKKTSFIMPVIKILKSTFVYNGSNSLISISPRFRSAVNCYFRVIDGAIDNFKDIVYSDEFINFLKELHDLLLE